VIVYLETSAFVKFIVDEDGTNKARDWFGRASLAASSVITFPEACAALNRRALHARSSYALSRWLVAMESHRAQTACAGVDERRAGQLAVKHGLRGMDLIRFGAIVRVRDGALARSASASVAVAVYDRRLVEATEREGFAMLGGLPSC